MVPYSATALTSVPMTNAKNMQDFVMIMSASVKMGGLINPDLLTGLGTSDIHTYRIKFLNLLSHAGMDSLKAKILIQLCMQVKNYARLRSGLDLNKESWAGSAMLVDVRKFLEDYCCTETKKAGNKMPTVKIAESFPEICFLIHVTTFAMMSGSNLTSEMIENCVASSVRQPWIASLALDDSLQAINKAAVKNLWDSWGNGTKKDSNGDVIKFHEEFYANQANDKIKLVDFAAQEIAPTNGSTYSLKDLIDHATALIVETGPVSMPTIGM